MKTIEMMLRQMTDASSIIQDLRDTLRTIDPQFPAAEQSFNNAVATESYNCAVAGNLYVIARFCG